MILRSENNNHFPSSSGVALDGVILEGAFNSARQRIPIHPFAWVDSSILTICDIGFVCFMGLRLQTMFCVLLFEVLLEVSRHWVLFPRAMGRKQGGLSYWRQVGFNKYVLLIINNVVTSSKIRWCHFSFCVSAVWREWEARYFSFIQRTITWFPFILLSR